MGIDLQLFDLVGIYSDWSTTLFDGLPAVPGVHLRWSFRPELGFPRHGFPVIERGQGANQSTKLAHVTLPIYSRDFDSTEGSCSFVASSY